MADSVTRVTRESWGGRLKNAIGGVFFGLLLIVGSVLLLFWNEGRTVKRRQALNEGAATVVSVGPETVSSNNEGRLVHVTGEATTDAVLEDPTFGVRVNALELERKVEMYQWVERSSSETRKKVGGGTETVTTYSYSKDWSDQEIDSSSFEEPAGHQNPSIPFRSEQWVAEPITLGAFELSRRLSTQMDRQSPVPLADVDLDALRRTVDRRLNRQANTLFMGDLQSPSIGDVRIGFEAVQPATVSVVGRQEGSRLVAHASRQGSDIALLSYGAQPAEVMFQQAQRSNTVMSWVLRLVGLLLLWLGFGMVFGPLSVLADVLPPVGTLVGLGVGMVSFVLAAVVGLVTIALGWIVYRPLLGIALLALAAGILIWSLRRGQKKAAAQSAPSKPDLPPLPTQGS